MPVLGLLSLISRNSPKQDRYGVPGTPPWCTRNSTHAEGPITISGRSNAEEDTAIALGKQLISIPDMVHESRRYPLGIYRGLNFGLVLHPQGAPETYLEGTATRHGQLSSDAGARAVLNALDRLTGGYKAQAATAGLPAAYERRPDQDPESRLRASGRARASRIPGDY